MEKSESMREAAVAGVFYPDEPEVLTREIDAMMEASPDAKVKGDVVGLICPHAGYAYSGPTAAAGYRHVRGKSFEAVVVLAPSHRESFPGASVLAEGCYRTPLGPVPVDGALAGAMVSADPGDVTAGWAGHRLMPEGFPGGLRGEHALEVQLPFLQRALPNTPIVPVVVGRYDPAMCRRIGRAFSAAIGDRKVLMVVSSDLYHGEDERACEESDARTLAAFQRLDAQGLVSGLKKGAYQACGAGPGLIALEMAGPLGITGAHILAHTHSNAVSGKRGGYVVGYGSVAFVKS